MTDEHTPLYPPPTAVASEHLSDAQLLGHRSEVAVKHLADCLYCQTQRDEVAPGAAPDDDIFERALRTSLQAGPPPAWREALPSLAVLSLGRRGTRERDVQAGQLWRVAWGSRTLMVSVIATEDWLVQAAPVTTDIALANEYTVIVPGETSPLETPLAIWMRQTRMLPMFAFDIHLADLPTIGDAPSAHALLGVLAAFDAGDAPDTSIPTGARLIGDDLDRLAMEDALAEQMFFFAKAAVALTEMLHRHSDDTRTVADRLRDTRLSVRELAERSHLAPAEIYDLKSKGIPPTRQQSEQLAPVLDVAPEELTSTPPPVKLIIAVSRPSLRERRTAWTRASSADTFADDPLPLIENVLASAARSVSGHGAVVDDSEQRFWDDRVALLLHA